MSTLLILSSDILLDISTLYEQEAPLTVCSFTILLYIINPPLFFFY